MKKRIAAFLMAICCAAASLPLDVLAEGVEAPAVVAETTEAPANTEAPVETTEAPANTETPVETTEAPANTEAPVETTEAPANTETPVETTEAPANTEVPVETTEAPANTEVPVETTEAPANTEVPVETTEAPANTEVPVETTEAPAATENPIDSTRDASFSPAFCRGYAEILNEDAETRADGGERFLLPEELIVYVEERDGEDHLLVWLDTPDGKMAGWTDCVNVRPLSEEETAAFVEAASREADVCFLDDEKQIPLERTDKVKFPDREEMAQLPEQTEVPEEELSQTPAQEVSTAAVQMTVEESRTVSKGEVFRVAPTYSDGAEYASDCTISDETVVGRTEDGAFVALQVGTAILTFEGAQGSAVCTVRVESTEPEWVRLPYDTLSIGVGEKVQLEPDVGGAVTKFEYATSKKKVATVSKDGVVKGVKKGSAKIRVRTENGKEVIVTVKVYSAPKKVTASAKKLTLGVGETATIGYKLPSKTMGGVTFASSDESIAKVDAKTGEVQALKAGTAKIRIRTYNKKNAYTTIEVKNAPQSVSVSPQTVVVGVGQTINVSASVNAGSAGKTAWSSADGGVATCKDGAITGVKVGETLAIATAYNGVVGQCAVKVVAAPEKVVLPYDTLYIGVGEKVQIEADCGETDGGLTYATSQKKVATVSKDGVVKGVKKGSAKIRVRTYNGQEAIVAVKVYSAPKKVTASAKKLTLGVGETATIGYKLPSKTMGGVTFASSDESIVKVDAKTGEVQALKAGTAKIRIRTYNKKNAYTTIEVKNAPQSVSVSPQTIVVGVGQTINVSASVNAGSAGKTAWSSADDGVATCKDGAITGVRVGETLAIATAYNGVVGQCAVKVVAAPEKVVLPYDTLYIGVGEKVQLKPEAGEIVDGFSYATSKKKTATVSKDGVVKGVKKGSAKIRVRAYNGKELIINVKVCAAPKKVTASVQRLELGAGESARIVYKLTSGTASSVTFASSNESVARVNAETGEVTAVQPGQAIIRLRTFNNKKCDCTVTVYAAPEQVTLNASSLELGEGQTFQLSPAIAEQCRTTFAYSSSDSGVVEISETGLLKAVRAGSATVRVQTHVPEVWAELTVDVRPAPTSVTLDIESLRLQPGETYLMNPVVSEGGFGTLAFASSNETVASVSADGLITALKCGTATLTASTYNGKSAKLELTVWDPNAPASIQLTNIPECIRLEDGKYAMEYSVEPSGSKPKLNWSSSDPSVATVDSDGVISPKSYGYTRITASSKQDETIQAQFMLTVQTDQVTLVIPARTTQESGIMSNLWKIDNIRASAIEQVEALKDGGVISASDASKRKSMINNIFKDYAFPWKTPAYQKYWKAANSEGGVKDFRTDRVYFGMPYTSGSSTNRRYNSSKAVSEKRYTDSGKGYYLLNRNKLLNGSYVGNDCSALVNMAIWGVSSGHSYDRTTDIASSSAYKTVKNYKSMRPGDLLCKGGSHVVMFLYYANAEKTKIMIIENGGEEAGTNTVHCAVHSLSYYTGKGYKVRRLSSLG